MQLVQQKMRQTMDTASQTFLLLMWRSVSAKEQIKSIGEGYSWFSDEDSDLDEETFISTSEEDLLCFSLTELILVLVVIFVILLVSVLAACILWRPERTSHHCHFKVARALSQPCIL